MLSMYLSRLIGWNLYQYFYSPNCTLRWYPRTILSYIVRSNGRSKTRVPVLWWFMILGYLELPWKWLISYNTVDLTDILVLPAISHTHTEWELCIDAQESSFICCMSHQLRVLHASVRWRGGGEASMWSDCLWWDSNGAWRLKIYKFLVDTCLVSILKLRSEIELRYVCDKTPHQ